MISIKNFVDVDINVLVGKVGAFSGFGTTIYFTEATIVTPAVADGNFVILESMDDFDNKVNTELTDAVVRKSVQAYFDNGGVKLCLVVPTVFTLEGFKADLLNVTAVVQDYFFVVIGDLLAIKSPGYILSSLVSIVNFGSGNGWSDGDLKSINRFRICLTTDSATYVDNNSLLGMQAVVKYSTYKDAGKLIDAALLVGAYFSRVDTGEFGAIRDYNFTQELLGEGHFEDVSQSTFNILNGSTEKGYYNFIGKVSNKVLNIGGDYCGLDKASISLDFGASCIERDLDFAIIELLFGKLPLTQEGQSKLVDAIKSQLVNYVDNGFLETDATYSGETKKVFYNGNQYTIVNKGDILPLGYRVFYVPINAVSAADKSAKRFPYIFVALQSVHGARVIQVNGSIL